MGGCVRVAGAIEVSVGAGGTDAFTVNVTVGGGVLVPPGVVTVTFRAVCEALDATTKVAVI
jgi:hypothetical protein